VVYEGAVNDRSAAPTEMMPQLEIGGMALAGLPADFGITTSASCAREMIAAAPS